MHLPGSARPSAPRRCPHCGVEIAASPVTSVIGTDPDGDWGLQVSTCTNAACQRLIIELLQGKFEWVAGTLAARLPDQGMVVHLVRPRTPARKPVPAQVPDRYRVVVTKAAAVLTDSPEASAALTRRALQELLIEHGATKKNLVDQIQEVLDSGELPSHIAVQLDGVRAIGNFGGHPIKSTSTGEIMDVQPGEASWNIDTLEALLDWYYVQADVRQRKIAELNARMAEAGKPPVR
jgi:uncharacterized protein DUF4145